MPENIKTSPTIFKRAVKGGWWIFASRITQQLMAMVRLVVLARILNPEDFGLLGLALLTISILNQFSVTGFNVALVQKKGDIKDYLSSAWTFGLIRGVVLYCILFAAAPYVAVFFESPDVSLIIRVIGLSAIVSSFNNIGMIFFQKELDFKRQFIFTNLGTAANVLVAVVLAVIYRSVWALVAGQFAGTITRCVLSYVLHSYRPSLQLDWSRIRDMWVYGKHVMVTSMLKFFCLEGDDIFLGKVLGTYTLGLYRYAYKVSNMVATDISDLVGRIAFPAFSKMQDKIDKIRAGYVKSSQVVMLIIFPISGGMIILANELILVVFGVEWFEMASAMQILCVLGITKSNQGGSVFSSLGRPDIIKWLTVLRLAFIALSIYPLTKIFGMAGTAASVTFPGILFFPLIQFYVKKLIGYPIRDYVKMVSLPMLATILMMLIVFSVRICFEDVNIYSLILLVAVGVVSYSLLILGLGRFYKEYKFTEIVRNLMGGLK